MFLKIFAALVLAVVFGGGYTLFFTSIPYQAVIKVLPPHQVQVDEVGGSLMSGLTLKNLKIDNNYFRFDIQEYEHSFNGLANMTHPEKLEIKSVMAKNAVLEFKPAIYERKTKAKDSTTASQDDGNDLQDEQDQRQALQELRLIFSIVKIDFENLKLIIPANPKMPMVKRQEFNLNKFVLDSYIFEMDKKPEYFKYSLSVGKTLLDTDTISYELNNFILDKHKVQWDDGAKVVLKKKASAKLVSDLDLLISGQVEFFKSDEASSESTAMNPMATLAKIKPNIKLQALNQQIELQIKDQFAMQLQAKGFNPQQFFATNIPVTNIHFSANIDNPMMLMMMPLPVEEGRFNIGLTEFKQWQQPQINRAPASVPGLPAGFNMGVPPQDLTFTGNIAESQVTLELESGWFMTMIKGLKPSPAMGHQQLPQLKFDYLSDHILNLDEFLQASLGEGLIEQHVAYFNIEEQLQELSPEAQSADEAASEGVVQQQTSL